MPLMVSTPGVITREDPRARVAAAAGFFTQGFVFISLTTRLPDVQDHWGFSDTTLSLLLLMMVLLAGIGTVLAETACKRVDSAAIQRVGLLAIALMVMPEAHAAHGVVLGAKTTYVAKLQPLSVRWH